MSVCGWFAGGNHLDCCRSRTEQLHPAPPGHQELLYFFCQIGARGVIRKFRGLQIFGSPKPPAVSLQIESGWRLCYNGFSNMMWGIHIG